MHNIPTAFQRKTLWTAITALSIGVTGALAVGLVYLITRIIAFLQPLLIPFALAAVLAYLLDPVVNWLGKKHLKRRHAVWAVFLATSSVFVGVLLIIIPAMVQQSSELSSYVRDNSGRLHAHVTEWIGDLNDRLHKSFGISLISTTNNSGAAPAAGAGAPPASPTPPPATAKVAAPETAAPNEWPSLIDGDWIARELPSLTKKVWDFIREGIGGFLGVFGFLVSLVIVPLYLYYFLMEGPQIADSWSMYVPLRASHFKDELVSTLEDINHYLIAFFRGQLVVSMINGVITAIGLTIVGLKFGWLIGLTLCILGIIPYLGVIACWIPSVIIASVQQSNWFISPQGSWWALPLAVTCVFVFVNQLDGFFITPRILGNSVGLHPMTVIASVFAWTLILGGILGAILAVPMTAAVKVLFQRFIWRRSVEPHLQGPARHTP